MLRMRVLFPLALAYGASACYWCGPDAAAFRAAPPGPGANIETIQTGGAAGLAGAVPSLTTRHIRPSPPTFPANSGADWLAEPADVARTAERSPATAFCRACLFPGGGHFYTGETTRGAIILGVSAGSLLAGALLSDGDAYGECVYDPETYECRGGGGRTPLWIGAGVAAGSWIFGIIDSRRSAARVNARVETSSGLGLETRPLIRLTGEQPGVGLQMRLVW